MKHAIIMLIMVLVVTLASCMPPPPGFNDPDDPDDPGLQPPPDDWVFCAYEREFCDFQNTALVRYGLDGSYFYQEHTHGVMCENAVFGDPLKTVNKQCHYSYTADNPVTPPPEDPVDPAPIDDDEIYKTLFDSSLVFFAGFDDTSRLGYDTSAYGRNGIASSDVTSAQGRFGTAAAFDGAGNNNISYSYDTALGMSSRISMSAWVYRIGSGQSSTSVIAGRPQLTNSGHQQYALGLTPDNTIRWRLRFGTTLVNAISSSPIPDRTWTHVVGTYDGSFMRLYINGVLSSEVARTGTFNADSAPLIIGSDPASDNRRFSGRVDEMAIYNKALSPEEVTLLNGLENGLGYLVAKHVEPGSADPGDSPTPPPPHEGGTVVSVSGEKWYINGRITNQGAEAEGLLLNSRMVQATFEDENPDTVGYWKYPDGTAYDPERNTDEFIAMIPTYKAYGLDAVTVSLQGGRPRSGTQLWINTAFKSDGSLKPAYMARMARVIEALDQYEMVAILSFFYFGQDQNIKDEAAILKATDNAMDWVLQKGYTNVVIEVANEAGHSSYSHSIFTASRIHELVSRARNRANGRLLVSTSFGGGQIPPDSTMLVSDFHLPHGNGQTADQVSRMITTIRSRSAYGGKPITFNEDSVRIENFNAAVAGGAGWGYYDQTGFQSPPTDWRINTANKQAFFDRVKELSKSTSTDCNVYTANSNNQIIMEAESATLAGKWQFSNQYVTGFTGTGFVAYMRSNKPNDGSHTYDGVSELKYRFRITDTGHYTIDYRGARYDPGLNYEICASHDTVCCPNTASDCTRADLNNDVYMLTTGVSQIKSYISLSTSRNSWRIGATFEDNSGNKYTPVVYYDAGVHELLVRGRSNMHAVDRIYIFKGTKPSATAAESEKICV
jgi:hypothetical protein